MISEREAMFHAERHLVLNMIGSEEMRIEIGPVHRLAPYDTVVVASDGLWDNLYVEEVAELLRPTTLRDAPIVRCSAQTGDGIEALKAPIDSALDALPPARYIARPRRPHARQHAKLTSADHD